MTTIENLSIAIASEFDIEVTPKMVASILCGENMQLAENPFSRLFLENVAHNSNRSFKAVLYLQLMYLQNNQ